MKNKGFTLIELLIAISIIAALAGAVIMALNPRDKFEEATFNECSAKTSDELYCWEIAYNYRSINGLGRKAWMTECYEKIKDLQWCIKNLD